MALSTKKEGRITFAERAISIYSPSGSEGEFAQLLYSELRSRALEPRIDSAGNLICEFGSGNPSILFCGHMDTVPGKLPIRREGTIIYGRGACDAKGPLMSLLFAFEDAAERFKSQEQPKLGKVIFAAVTEEERNSVGLLELIKNNVRADVAVFGEPCGVGKVTVGYRGHVPARIEVRTKEAHASAPWLASNAAEAAFSIYGRAKQLWPSGVSGGNGAVSISLTQINAGSSHNVTPGSSSMTLDIRVPFGLRCDDVKSKIRSLISESNFLDVHATVEFGESTEPYRTNLNSNLVRAFNRTLMKSGFAHPELVTKSGTGDMNTYSLAFGVDSVTYGPGDTKLSHTKEERVDAEEIFACSRILCDSAFEFFSLSSKKR